MVLISPKAAKAALLSNPEHKELNSSMTFKGKSTTSTTLDTCSFGRPSTPLEKIAILVNLILPTFGGHPEISYYL